MRRYGQVIRLRPEMRDEYVRLHAAVWPGVLATIRDCNISDYSIWLRMPEHLLFAQFDYAGADFAADMARMAADPETQRWWAVCKPCHDPLETRGAEEWWAGMTEIFRMD